MGGNEALVTQYRFHLVPNSNHNMQMDNPEAMVNIIVNDLLGGTELL